MAVVGASRDPHKLGAVVLQNLLQTGFHGRIIPVNPEAGEIMGQTAYKKVSAIPGRVDLAVVVVPAAVILPVIRDLGRKKVPAAVVISAGFREVGADGVRLEQELVRTARAAGVRIIGPNCLGIMNPHIGLNATFASTLPSPGKAAFISQSGAMGVATLDWAMESDLGFRAFVSIGNHADLNEIDWLEFFGSDPDTGVILLYVESFSDGRKFVEVASRITPHKPIVVVKAGRTYKSLQAIQTHTGSLAGSGEIATQALRQAGVIVANTAEELFDYAMALSVSPPLKIPSVGIITNAGGPGVLAIDELRRTQIIAPELSQRTLRQLRQVVLPAGSMANPIDVLGDASADRYIAACRITLHDPYIGGVLAVLTPQSTTDVEAIARGLIQLRATSSKPIIACFMGGDHVEAGRRMLREAQIPEYATPERAVHALDVLRWGQTRTEIEPVPRLRPRTLPKKYTAAKAPQLHFLDVQQVLLDYHFPIIPTRLITQKTQLNTLSFPAVFKVATAHIVHKNAVGGVVFVHSLAEARHTFDQMLRITLKAGGKKADGVIVQPQIQAGHTEMMLGAKRDPSFGIILLVGLGGVFVEVARDIVMRLGPLSEWSAVHMVSRLRLSRHLSHVQHTQIAQALMQLSDLMFAYPQIFEVDINPLTLSPDGPLVLDARIFLQPQPIAV